MVTPKGRMNPQPSGMTVPDESFRVDPSHFPRPQEPDPWVPMMPFYGHQPPGSFSWMPQSWQSEVADVPTQEWTPYSGISRLISGEKIEDGELVPGRSSWDVAEAALDTTDFLPSGGPVGDLLGLGAKGIGKVASAIPWGDVASFAGKAIPEGTVAGLAWPSWYMRETRPPKGINKKIVDKLEDMWKHPIWTDDRWVRTPEPDQIREIGARALYMDDIANDVPNTSVDMYMQQGSGVGQTLQQKISQLQRGGFGGNPQRLTKESDHFNKLAVDMRSGDDELMGRADYWIETHEDMLQDSYGIDMFDDRMEPIFRTDEQWAKEFDKLSRELADDAKAVEKSIADDINRIMDEELKIMNRGMEEFTGKGTIGGASGTIPPQGTGGVLPTKVNDSITNVRKAVDEAMETSTPVEPTVMGMPAREIPSDWRASMPDKPYELDDVKMEVAWEAELESIAGLEKEMANRGVTLTPAIRGQIETARKILQGKSGRTNHRESTLLYDMIAEANGGRSIYTIDDILSDLSNKELGFNFDDLVVDWDTMGQPKRGVESNILADQIDEEIRKLFYGASPQ